MSENKILKAAVTCGDPNGVGCEVIVKTFLDPRMNEVVTPVVYGSSKAFALYRKGIEGAENFSVNQISSPREANPRRFNLIECAPDDLHIEPGKASAESAGVAVAALRAAVADLKAGLVDVLITAPIDKNSAQAAGLGFVGHTEWLASEFGGEPLMVMCSELMKVALATIHLPVQEVAQSLSTELIVGKLNLLRDMLRRDFEIVEPRIAVLALNPHAGDRGLTGTQEAEIIKPAIEQAVQQGVLAFGPFAADGFFASGNCNRYDAVLAMYHDQGLAPFKALTPDGVNYTAGLNVVRTSPDHGVAYDIAGQGKADEQSMRNAIYLAVDVFNSRRRMAETDRNPLRHYEREKGRDVSVNDLPEVD